MFALEDERAASLPSSLTPTPKLVTFILTSRTLLVLASMWSPTVGVPLPGPVMVWVPPVNATLEAAISMHAPEIETKVRSWAIVKGGVAQKPAVIVQPKAVMLMLQAAA